MGRPRKDPNAPKPLVRGAPKKYSGASLKRAVNEYFDGITREKHLTERVPTGLKDKDGHQIYEEVEVLNKLGQPLTVTEFLVPPSVIDLCIHLKINKGTWENYAKDPDMAETVEQTRAIMQAWNVREMLTRQGKDIKGIMFNLENNYGYSSKQNIEFGGVEEYLAQLAQEGGGRQF